MSKVHQFHFVLCRNGHLLYSHNGKPSEMHCERCGSDYLTKCENCGAPIPGTFWSRVYFTSGRPVSFPKPPNYCIGCGSPYPWYKSEELPPALDFWCLLHPSVTGVAKDRFDSGYYADAVEAALKALNVEIKKIYISHAGKELDGVPLMRQAFRVDNPVIVLDDLGTETGRSIQQGYMDLFAGAIAGIRNPKAHDNLVIEEERAIHHLFVTSLLFHKLDERK